MSLTWDNAEGVAAALYKAHPEIDPLKVRFTDLYQKVTRLPDFIDDPFRSTEAQLEAIHMAWYEEWQAAQDR